MQSELSSAAAAAAVPRRLNYLRILRSRRRSAATQCPKSISPMAAVCFGFTVTIMSSVRSTGAVSMTQRWSTVGATSATTGTFTVRQLATTDPTNVLFNSSQTVTPGELTGLHTMASSATENAQTTTVSAAGQQAAPEWANASHQLAMGDECTVRLVIASVVPSAIALVLVSLLLYRQVRFVRPRSRATAEIIFSKGASTEHTNAFNCTADHAIRVVENELYLSYSNSRTASDYIQSTADAVPSSSAIGTCKRSPLVSHECTHSGNSQYDEAANLNIYENLALTSE